MNKQLIRGKQRARKLVVQALYQWALSGVPVYDIEAQFCTIQDMDKVDGAYFSMLLRGIVQNVDELNSVLMPFLDRTLDTLSPVELGVLRMGAFELLHCPEVPYRIVLDEAVSLAKTFGTQEGHRYVNGVLNNLARSVRSIEISQNEGK